MSMVSIVMLVGSTMVGPPDHDAWIFSITSSGENTSWTAPTPMRADGEHYEMLYTVQGATVMVSFIGLIFGPIDVLDMIPADVIATWRFSSGPCPLDFGWTEVVAPEDQDPPALAFDWMVELDAKGMTTYRMENVFQGQAEYDLGWPWGTVIVDIESGTIIGEVAIDIVTSPCYADIDGNGVVDVVDLLEVIANWGYCPDCPADPNQDSEVDVTDLLMLVGDWGACPS